MITASDRHHAVAMINQAIDQGSRQAKACEEMGISSRTYQRWTREEGQVKVDARPDAPRPEPKHKLTEEERAQILSTVNSPDFQSLPPSQIVPALADQGEYIASESSFYRVLREEKLQNARGRSQAPKRKTTPTTHSATGPNQLWSWDISWLPGPAKGVYFYLYMVIDVFSRKVVGWEIHHDESAVQASELVRKAHMKEGVGVQPLVLHSDNGSPMKGASLLETLYDLGVSSSYSRPRVSNDNAYSESLFRTCKYRPDYPYQGFKDLVNAREWMLGFVRWYNEDHKHSGIRFVSPAERHSGEARDIMINRQAVYEAAKAKNPRRWSGNSRDWSLPTVIYLNPEKTYEELKLVS